MVETIWTILDNLSTSVQQEQQEQEIYFYKKDFPSSELNIMSTKVLYDANSLQDKGVLIFSLFILFTHFWPFGLKGITRSLIKYRLR